MAYIKSHIILPLFCCLLTLGASAQTADANICDRQIFNHLEVGANLGTTGVGLNLAMPVTDIARVRMGVDYMPRTCVPLTFNLMSYAGTDENVDDDSRFNRLSELMQQFTGVQVDRKVKMNAKGTMVDFKFLVDIFPLKNNRHFYATAGFYWGASKVGHVENKIEEAPSLMGVLMYNRYYDYFMNYTYCDEPIFKDVYIDPFVGDELRGKFERYGRVGAHVGNFKDGTPYMLEPDANGMVHADMYVNHFKPYLGVGYTTTVSKDGRWSIGVDVGALFWGRPHIYTHEQYYYDLDKAEFAYGTLTDLDPDKDGVNNYTPLGHHVDLATDVSNISGKVGTYVNIAKAMHVYPVLNFKIALKLF